MGSYIHLSATVQHISKCLLLRNQSMYFSNNQSGHRLDKSTKQSGICNRQCANKLIHGRESNRIFASESCSTN